MDKSAPHFRQNPLTGEWVLVSPQRSSRPWRGELEAEERPPRLAYDPSCYLCPGNARAGETKNPSYRGIFVFDNDYPALLPQADLRELSGPGWMQSASAQGHCRVVCYSPRHDLSLSEMDAGSVCAVVETWVEQTAELLRRPEIGYVQVFENRGEAMGCSNPHPHGQIWATSQIPNELLKEDLHQAEYRERHRRRLLEQVLSDELASGERLVLEGSEWVALVPFWASWPFETLLLPRRAAADLPGLDPAQKDGLVEAWQGLLRKYDLLFGAPMPLSCGWHQAPKGSQDRLGWQLHAHFYPPLRGPKLRKFMVGFEMLAGPQRDLTPEQAALLLRR